VDAWANGEALSIDDMKGTVVLLDFFAVWCGPCVATFPHLKKWHEQYANRGLHVIGVSRYYEYGWDGGNSRPVRDREIEPEQEREATEHFLKHHQLQHRIAYVTDSDLQQHYLVSGIPHVVLIDRAGKVRLFRIGSNPQNAVDLEEAIVECLDETSVSQ
jgi:thiol-disulfide isomerase/thioredoxin